MQHSHSKHAIFERCHLELFSSFSFSKYHKETKNSEAKPKGSKLTHDSRLFSRVGWLLIKSSSHLTLEFTIPLFFLSTWACLQTRKV